MKNMGLKMKIKRMKILRNTLTAHLAILRSYSQCWERLCGKFIPQSIVYSSQMEFIKDSSSSANLHKVF